MKRNNSALTPRHWNFAVHQIQAARLAGSIGARPVGSFERVKRRSRFERAGQRILTTPPENVRVSTPGQPQQLLIFSLPPHQAPVSAASVFLRANPVLS